MTKLFLEEMSCNHCVSRITNALNGLGFHFFVDLESKTVTLEESEMNVKKAMEELDDLGFTSTVLE